MANQQDKIADRVCDLGEDLRNHVFELLDEEIFVNGDEAGKVAHAVEEAFLCKLNRILNGNDDS